LAALIACGADLETASRESLGYLDRALDAGFRPDMGHVVADRLFWAHNEDDDLNPDAPSVKTSALDFSFPGQDIKH
jgi:hydroxymethylpyrimidine/phosphomethylpyrimidine kinase